MKSKWPQAKIESIAEKIGMGPFGSNIKVSTFVKNGIPIISGQHLHKARLTDSDYNFITKEHAEKLKNSVVYRGDIVFTHAGNIGQVAYIPDNSEYESYVLSQRQFYLRCDKSKVLPEFITYYFKTEEGQHKLLANSSQVGVPSLARPVSYLRTIEIPLPSLNEQDHIVHVITSLENKIDLNRNINQTLEQIAQAIFKSWFVDFDPVKAKIEAKEKGEDSERAAMCAISGKSDEELNKLSPEQLEQLSKTASLFPDELEESELGMIPKGWRIYSLGNILEFAYGKALKEADRNGGSIPVFGSNGQVGWHDEKFVEGPGIVVGRKGNPGIVTWVQTDFFPIDTTFYVVSKIKAVSLYFLFHALQYHDLPSLASDSAVPGLNRNLTYMNVQVIPASELIGKFDELVEKIHSMISQNDAVISTLATIRDTLLPKLLSGELKV